MCVWYCMGQELRALGLSADIIVCRSSELLLQSTKNKISSFCHVDASHIISVHDVSNIYHVPLILAEQSEQAVIHTVHTYRTYINYMYTHSYTYIHTFMSINHIYVIHTYAVTFIYTYTVTYIHTYIHTYHTNT